MLFYSSTNKNVYDILLQLQTVPDLNLHPFLDIFNSLTVPLTELMMLRVVMILFIASLCHFSLFCWAVLHSWVVCSIFSFSYILLFFYPPFFPLTFSPLRCSCCITFIYTVLFFSDLPVIHCIFSISVSGAVSDSYWSAVSGSGSGVTSLQGWSHFLHTSSVGLTAGRLIHILAEVQGTENNAGATAVTGAHQ